MRRQRLGWRSTLANMPKAWWRCTRRPWDVQRFNPYHAARKCLRLMAQHSWGQILRVSIDLWLDVEYTFHKSDQMCPMWSRSLQGRCHARQPEAWGSLESWLVIWRIPWASTRCWRLKSRDQDSLRGQRRADGCWRRSRTVTGQGPRATDVPRLQQSMWPTEWWFSQAQEDRKVWRWVLQRLSLMHWFQQQQMESTWRNASSSLPRRKWSTIV